MLRSGASRAILGSLTRTSQITPRSAFLSATSKAQRGSHLTTLCSRRPLAATRSVTGTFVRSQTTTPPLDKKDQKHEQQVGREKLQATPETVSTTSSVHPVLEEVGTPEAEPDTDMMAGIRSDMVRSNLVPHSANSLIFVSIENYFGNFFPQRCAS